MLTNHMNYPNILMHQNKYLYSSLHAFESDRLILIGNVLSAGLRAHSLLIKSVKLLNETEDAFYSENIHNHLSWLFNTYKP